MKVPKYIKAWIGQDLNDKVPGTRKFWGDLMRASAEADRQRRMGKSPKVVN